MSFKDIRSALFAVFALQSTSLTAGGSGDNTEITGASINIANLPERPSSVVFDIPCRAVLAATKKLTVIGRIQESVDGVTWTNIAANATLLTLTGGSGGTTETGMARLGCDCHRKNANFLRCMITPDLDAANTDTAVVGAGVANFGGLAERPGN